MTFTAGSTPELLKFFEDLKEEDKASLFIPGNSFELIYEDRRIQYVALDPRQRLPNLDLEEMVSEAELCISTAELVLSDEEYEEFTERVTELL